MEEPKNEVVEEAQPQEVVQESEPVQQETAKPKDVDKNWVRANAIMEAQKAEIEALKASFEQERQRKQQLEEEADEFDKLPDDELITKQQYRKQLSKDAKKIAKQAIDEYDRSQKEVNQQRLISESEERTRQKYQDFDYVMETYALPMIRNDPALRYQLTHSKNPAEAAYKLGKLSDDYEEQHSQAPVSPKAEKILKNSSRPVSGNAVSPSLKGQADAATNMTPAQIWEMSQKYARTVV